MLQGLRGAVGQQQCRKHEWQQAELRQKRKVQCKEHAKRDEQKRGRGRERGQGLREDKGQMAGRQKEGEREGGGLLQ